MILFAADNHYDAHPGRTLYEALKEDYSFDFYEDDWRCFEGEPLQDRYDFIVLNMIADTCGVPAPSAAGASNLRQYLEQGGSLLLLHGSSAAFWPEAWWRPLVGMRWVRGEDPDGVEPSTHPVGPYQVLPCKSAHPLVQKLQPIAMPKGEVYINLEFTAPIFPLMETTIEQGTFIQAYESLTPYGGKMLCFMPGHDPEAFAVPELIQAVRVMLDDLGALPARR